MGTNSSDFFVNISEETLILLQTFLSKHMADLSQEAWMEQLSHDENAVIMDVRTEEELEELGMIPNALHLDIYESQEFMDAIQKFDKNKSYYIYCRSGVRSGQACAILNQIGIDKAYNLLGGFIEWEGDVVTK